MWRVRKGKHDRDAGTEGFKTRNCQMNMKALVDEADSMREHMVTKRKEDSKEESKEMLKTISC